MTRELPRTFGDALRQHAEDRPDVAALNYEGNTISYSQFDAHTNQVANALLRLGLEKGDRIAYLGKNSDLAIELVFGAAKAGIVFVPIIWRLAPAEVEHILADSGAAALFVEPQFGSVAAKAASRGLTVISSGDAFEAAADFNAFRNTGATTRPQVEVNERDTVVQLYTSGTTGKPKGVMLSHANGISQLIHQRTSGIDWLANTPGEITIIAMPFGHIGGVGVAMNAVYDGLELLIHRDFEPTALMSAIETFRVKRLFLVPAAIRILLEHPAAATTDFSSIELMGYGASPIPLPLLQEAVDRIGCGFVQYYGMTETWGLVVALPPEDHKPGREHKMTSAGKALPGVELRIVDPSGAVLPPHSVGEIAVRSASNMQGYWKRPEDTAKSFLPGGWLLTGDAGLMDEEGYLFIQDRIKDMIITGAENVYPAEVESAIFGHSAVADVGVIGVPDAKWGEAVKAIVVLKPQAAADEEEIIAYARERIAGFKCPKSVEFVAALPRNPSGKILRRALREPYWAGLDRRVG